MSEALEVYVARAEQIPDCLGWAVVWLTASRTADGRGDWTIRVNLSRMVMQELFGLGRGEWPAVGSRYRLRIDSAEGEARRE